MGLFSEKELLEIAEGIDSLTITIKAKENFIDILKRVSEEAEKGCPDVSQQMSDNEISKAIADCIDNPDVSPQLDSETVKALQHYITTPDCGKKEKKKKNKKFKLGDVVYWGKRAGLVTEVFEEKDEASICVCFQEILGFRKWEISFTKDGRFINGTPIVLSHEPYELKMKKIK